METPPALETKHLSKSFGRVAAVADVNITVSPKDVYALIGENGAGKTTLVNLITGLLTADRGTVEVGGHNIIHEPIAARRAFGYVPDNPEAYGYLTGREFLVLTGRLRGMPAKRITGRIRELSVLFPLSGILDRTMGEYSRGNRQKVAVLSALLDEPPVLIVDEPIVGLDAPSIITLGKTFRSYAESGRAVFFVTHILDFARQYATRAGIMKDGKIIRETGVTEKTDLEKLALA